MKGKRQLGSSPDSCIDNWVDGGDFQYNAEQRIRADFERENDGVSVKYLCVHQAEGHPNARWTFRSRAQEIHLG